jgi:uncharacterized protein
VIVVSLDAMAGASRFPEVAYLPGSGTRPERRDTPPPAALDPAQWRACEPYVFGFALFDHGYYWEAHECWEALWIAAGRRGAVAELLRGLIQLAAAGVKIRQGRGTGAAGLAARARGHIARAQALCSATHFAGIDLTAALAFAEAVACDGPSLRGSASAAVEIVFAGRLSPSR